MSFTFQKYQKEWDWQSYIYSLESEVALPEDSIIDLDVLFVGAGPAGLSGAIRLKQLCKESNFDIQIGVIEKASHIGGHSLSGAVINPVAFKKLFPEVSEKNWPFRQKVGAEKLFYLTSKNKIRLPSPPTMKNKNFYTASLCEVLRWMGEKAEAMDISIFTSFTAHKLLTENTFVKGISTVPAGLDRAGHPSSSYQPPTFIRSKLTVLTDGSRGHLSQTWRKWKKIQSYYPQTYALGVKEIWELPSYKMKQNEIWHTMGWPLPADCFGGAWVYPLGENLLSLGLVAGLDSPLQNLDVHAYLQQLKYHPLLAQILEGGKCVEWGAKTIPEGGYHSIPRELHDDGLLVAGDAANMVNVPALKGIHYAMTAGMLTAETAFLSLKKNDFSKSVLKNYTKEIKNNSCIGKELYPVRNVRQAFKKNIFWGLIKSGLMFLTKGLFPGDRLKGLTSDAKKNRTQKIFYSYKQKGESNNRNKNTISKTDGAYLAGNKTRDDLPPHLQVSDGLPHEVEEAYSHLCPAGVYEKKNGKFIINASNCIDCKATDVLGPRWHPKEGGSGPNYSRM